MHIEKNIIVSLMKILSNAKEAKSDSLALRQELQARGMMKELHPRQTNELDRDGNAVYTYARAPWIWTQQELQIVMDVMRSIRPPTNYGSSLSYKIGDKKMVGLKTHDWHNILHDILPIAIQGTLTSNIRDVVYRLSQFFKKVCAKEIRVDDIPMINEEAAELATLMEMNLPPSFFDIQPHHILHLSPELGMAGPVRPRWMYFIERYMKVLKGWVRQMARPESSIAEGYITHEAMKYASEYITSGDFKWMSSWVNEDDNEMTGDHLPEAFTTKVMDDVYYEQAHTFVLMNHPSMAPWLDTYNTAKVGGFTHNPFRIWVRDAIIEGLATNDPLATNEALDISTGPNHKANFFAGL